MINRWGIFGVIAILLLGCDNQQPISLTAEQEKQQQELIDRQLANMVFIAGGRFIMGNSALGKDTTPEHRVNLDGFSLSRFKVTFGDYLLYRQLTGQPDNPYPDETNDNKDMERKKQSWAMSVLYQLNDHPATAPWSEARNYCLWLGEKTGLPIDLPTEAQWEYAAGARGQFGIATDNINIDHGFNVPIYLQRSVSALIKQGGTFPVGSFPPNRLGLYDMAGGGAEWMFDWYDSNYYAVSPEYNPRGPDKGETIVLSTFAIKNRQYQAHSLRNFSIFMFISGSARERDKAPDTPYDNQLDYMNTYTFRCAVNQSEVIK